jgi:hypothetical protein
MTRCRYCGNPIAFLQQYNWLRGKPEFCSEQHRHAFEELQTEGLKRLMALRIGLLEPDVARHPPVAIPAEEQAHEELVEEDDPGAGLQLASFVAVKLSARNSAFRFRRDDNPKTIRQHPATRRLNWHEAGISMADYVPVRFSPEMARPADTGLGHPALRFVLERPALPGGSAGPLSDPALPPATSVCFALRVKLISISPRHRLAPVVPLEEALQYPDQPVATSSRELRATGMIRIETPGPQSRTTNQAGRLDEVLNAPSASPSPKLTPGAGVPELNMGPVLPIKKEIRMANPAPHCRQPLLPVFVRSIHKKRFQWTVRQPQLDPGPGPLLPLKAFPACIGGSIPVDPHALEIQPGAAIVPVLAATVQSLPGPIREAEDLPAPTLHDLISEPIAPLPLSAVILLPTPLLTLKRGAPDEKKGPVSQLPAFADIPVEDLPAPSAPIFLSLPLLMGRSVRMTAAAKQVAAW